MTITHSPRRTAVASAILRVERTDIHFFNVAPSRVGIEIAVHNDGDAPSRPTTMRIEVAALGAFLPWRPLAVRSVPAIPAGGQMRVAFEAERVAVQPLGSFERVPPERLATAAAAGEMPGEPARGLWATLSYTALRAQSRAKAAELFRRRAERQRELEATSRARASLAFDLLELLGRGGTHWAGNLNVFLGRQRRVERHRAPALRIHPGKRNLAVFCLGTGPDAYNFEFAGEGGHWPTRLFLARGLLPRALSTGRSTELVHGRWHEFAGTTSVFVEIQPPGSAERGALEVHVRQRSSGESAVVEFDLDARAARPGCYTL